MSRIVPTEKLPLQMFDTLDGKAWPIETKVKPIFYLIVVYRGVQCSYCKNQLIELQQKLPQFMTRNVEVIALSTDSEERAQQAADNWQLKKLRLGYNLSIEAARKLGLYISSARRENEMPYFSEPGIFLVEPEQTLFATWLASYPFARTQLDEIIRCIDLIVEKNLPVRGTVK